MEVRKVKVGDTFGKWTATIVDEENHIVTAICECGNMKRHRPNILLDGLSLQCLECSTKSRKESMGYLSKVEREKREKKYPPCDPEKEQEMIQEFLKNNPRRV